MPDPMKIRAKAANGVATVRVLMSHEMETGLRKDASGALVPAWFIQQVSAKLNDKVVMNAQWGMSVSKNPYLQFNVKDAKPGDRISVTWVDNKGETRTDEAAIT